VVRVLLRVRVVRVLVRVVRVLVRVVRVLMRVVRVVMRVVRVVRVVRLEARSSLRLVAVLSGARAFPSSKPPRTWAARRIKER
jgi:hypothetical protein